VHLLVFLSLNTPWCFVQSVNLGSHHVHIDQCNQQGGRFSRGCNCVIHHSFVHVTNKRARRSGCSTVRSRHYVICSVIINENHCCSFCHVSSVLSGTAGETHTECLHMKLQGLMEAIHLFIFKKVIIEVHNPA